MTLCAPQHFAHTSCRRFLPVYVVEGLTSLGSNLLMVGVFFWLFRKPSG